jgi:transforming growth factor-beta-induced protein
MFGRKSLLKATALALPFGLAATAQAANITETMQQDKELGTFSKAMEKAGLSQQLTGQGPYTVFAPSDQAFEQLPKGALDELMKQDNQAQLAKLLEHHIVQGQAIAADDALGRQTQVQTMSGDALTVDGTSQVVLLVPAGLTISRVGDQVVVEREAVAVPAGAIEVEEQAVRKAGGVRQAQGQQEQQQAQTPVAQGSDMPLTKHQEEVLKSPTAEEQRQTAPAGSSAMPATEHQRQVLAEQQLPGEQQQSHEQARVEGKPGILREATVVEPDIQADNGVIHVINAVLVPQEVLKMLEGAKRDQG